MRIGSEVTVTFQADAPYRFMTVGVFLPDDDLEAAIRSGENPSLAYYFFDAFSLQPTAPPGDPQPVVDDIKEPGTGADTDAEEVQFGMFVPNAFSPNGDGLNDLFEPKVGDVMPSSFEIYTRWGERIAELDPGQPRWDGRDAGGKLLEPGVYIWSLEWPRSLPTSQRNQQGAVMLLH